jgi:hypothetical protein
VFRYGVRVPDLLRIWLVQVRIFLLRRGFHEISLLQCSPPRVLRLGDRLGALVFTLSCWCDDTCALTVVSAGRRGRSAQTRQFPANARRAVDDVPNLRGLFSARYATACLCLHHAVAHFATRVGTAGVHTTGVDAAGHIYSAAGVHIPNLYRASVLSAAGHVSIAGILLAKHGRSDLLLLAACLRRICAVRAAASSVPKLLGLPERLRADEVVGSLPVAHRAVLPDMLVVRCCAHCSAERAERVAPQPVDRTSCGGCGLRRAHR